MEGVDWTAVGKAVGGGAAGIGLIAAMIWSVLRVITTDTRWNTLADKATSEADRANDRAERAEHQLYEFRQKVSKDMAELDERWQARLERTEARYHERLAAQEIAHREELRQLREELHLAMLRRSLPPITPD